MKKIIIIFLIILNLITYIPTIAQSKKLILDGKTIIIDPGHGGKDIGTFYGDIYEKNINLSISLKLKKELEKYGAKVIMTREEDYDLSSPNIKYRKKSDFDNRIKLINSINPDFFLSIHQNYYHIQKYNGAQIFYKGNKTLANIMQENINPKRKIKPISSELYMYNKIHSEGLLIECGFLSNYNDRNNLINEQYQNELSKKIVDSIKNYFLNK